MSPSPIPFELIERCVTGEGSDADRARLESWAAESDDNRRLLNAMAAEWGADRSATYSADKGWSRMRRTIAAPAHSERSVRNVTRAVRYASVGAAALAIVVGIKLFSSTPAPAESQVYTTARGQRASITLADGSRVTLAPATTIKVTGRSVDLRGEALFTVTQHTETPFIVTANGTATRVLGTTFNVRAYDNQVRVAVAEGKVVVRDVVLSTGDIASVLPGALPVLERGSDVSTALAWAQGRLSFRLATLRDMISDLERWYGISIEVKDEKLLDRRLTITLTDEPASQAARVIGLALGVKAELKDKTLIMY